MIFNVQEKQLILKIDHPGERLSLKELKEGPGLESDASMYDFFDAILCNTEWDWIRPEEIGALTDAPILGLRDENEVITDVYGWIQYAITSLLEELYTTGQAILIKG
jgi:hypothetical protein